MKSFCLRYFIIIICCLSSCQNNNSDAFVLHYHQLNQSLHYSNQLLSYETTHSLINMEEIAHVATQYIPFVEKVKSAHRQKETLDQFIRSIKAKLISETGGVYNKEEALAIQEDSSWEGIPKGAKTTRSIEKILLMEKYDDKMNLPLAELLDQKIQAFVLYNTNWLDSLLQNSTFNTPTFEKETRNCLRQFKNNIALKTSLIYSNQKNSSKVWAEVNFQNKPLIAILNYLISIQNTIEIAQYTIINLFTNYLYSINNDSYNQVEIISHSTTPHVQVGKDYEATISLATYSANATFDVVIKGDTIAAINGKATCRIRPQKTGKQEHAATILITNPITGERTSINKKLSFKVIP